MATRSPWTLSTSLSVTQLNWRIYYKDGSTFSNLDGSPQEIPVRNGVQVINVRDGKKGRRTLKLVDYYVWSPTLDRWVDCIDTTSAICRALREPYIVLLAGEYLREADFEKVLIQAHNDPEFPLSDKNPWSR